MGQSYGEKNPCIQEHKRSGNAAGDIREGHQRKMKGDNIIQKKKKWNYQLFLSNLRTVCVRNEIMKFCQM